MLICGPANDICGPAMLIGAEANMFWLDGRGAGVNALLEPFAVDRIEPK